MTLLKIRVDVGRFERVNLAHITKIATSSHRTGVAVEITLLSQDVVTIACNDWDEANALLDKLDERLGCVTL